MSEQNESKKPALNLFQVTEGKDSKGFWTQIGVAWENSKGGFNLKLNCIPLNGEIVALPPKEKPEET